MKHRKITSIFICTFVILFITVPAWADPHFLIDKPQQWEDALHGIGPGIVEGMSDMEWQDYMHHWHELPEVVREGELYPLDTNFLPPELYRVQAILN